MTTGKKQKTVKMLECTSYVGNMSSDDQCYFISKNTAIWTQKLNMTFGLVKVASSNRDFFFNWSLLYLRATLFNCMCTVFMRLRCFTSRAVPDFDQVFFLLYGI